MTLGTFLFLGFIVVQRLAELVISKRNTAALMANGAREVGAGHYPVMVALHSAWMLCLLVFGHSEEIHPLWLALYAVLQVFRVWILGTLGPRWTTRIIVTDTPLVTNGPFRFIPHPNYTLVVFEIFVAPMVLGLLWVALVFSLLNAAMLYHRIRVEDGALRPN
ncbi:isoprenylcysteine carboxyl methyltransferase family protein [Roseobacter sp. GAI101]|uniref:isoprenylcysteine carboxyl methyltransferase family protein n=1 Tax=Roseobacter sp. (strain GAI101) TaxID=391589 RepID=UPI00018720D2|nr:isoprenylcysteine carboxylmethyltransferase family protein [Roseobacter sp. GAI101]EEB85237.1 isoprenylcysteine carboxyl methyltransferase [Roseobacter sp. GAI101]